MNARLAVAALVALGVSSCGPASDSFSCQNDTTKLCTTLAISGGTWTTKTCTSPSTSVASCAATGIQARCTVTGSIAGAVSCPAGATCTTTTVYFAGADLATFEAACTSVGGTWSTN